MVRERVRVTVCIPTFMREKLLRRCLESLSSNVFLPYQVIIINDGPRPLSFTDKRIEVVNNPERRGIGANRQKFAELVETEYMFFLDDDILIKPCALEFQIWALDRYPKLAAVSGVRFMKGRIDSRAADFKFVKDKIMFQKYNIKEILASDRDLFEADFIPIAHTTFRMKAIKDISFDPAAPIGCEHLDTFMQFYYTKWKCAIHKKSHFEHIRYESPKKYLRERHKTTVLEASRQHFIEKWGYRPVEQIDFAKLRIYSAICFRQLRHLVGRS